MGWETKNFKSSEFDDKGLIGSGDKMNMDFINLLQKCRDIAGVPFKITSGYRSPNRNANVGGVSESAHLKGRAADIQATSGREKWIIVNAALKAGFTRIGVYSTWIHLDNDPDLPPQVIWGK